MSSSPRGRLITDFHRARVRAFAASVAEQVTAARAALALRLAPPVPAPAAEVITGPMIEPGTEVGAPPLDVEAAAWAAAHHAPATASQGATGGSVPESTALIFADQKVQDWMGQTLSTLGWKVIEPVFILEGWVPARGENTTTGQPATTYTTGSKTSAAFARKTDPATSKKAGAAAAAAQSITVNSHQGRLLFAYADQHLTRPGMGMTAAEAVNAAGLLTDGAHGSPWHRVTDLRDRALITFLLDGTGQRSTRKNESRSEADVLVVTPLGLRAVAALTALREHGYPDYPLNFDGPADAALFEDLPATLARIESLPAPGPADNA